MKKILFFLIMIILSLFFSQTNNVVWNSSWKWFKSCNWWVPKNIDKIETIWTSEYSWWSEPKCWWWIFSWYTEPKKYWLWVTPCPSWRRAEVENPEWAPPSWEFICRQPDYYAPYFSNISYWTNNWWKNFNPKKWNNWNNEGNFTTSDTYIMAWVHNMNFKLTFNPDNNKSPISSIKARLDKPDWTSIRMDRVWSYWTYNYNTYEYNYQESFDFKIVTPYEKEWNYAVYKYVIEQICDDSIWGQNCSDKDYTIFYKVYANKLDIQKSIMTFDNNLVADWQEKKFQFDLKDQYWNKILPVIDWSNIIRDLNFQLEYENNVKLNQYDGTWEWIIWTNFYSWDDNKLYNEFQSSKTNFPDKKFKENKYKTWLYSFSLKPYSPTYLSTANDWREFVDGNAKIKKVSVKLSDISTSDSLIWETIDIQYKPMYITNITGSLKEDWIYPWFRQDSEIKFSKNNTTIENQNDIYMEFGKFENMKHLKHSQYFMWFDKSEWKSYINLPYRRDPNPSYKNIEWWKVTNNYWNPIIWNNKIITNVIQKWTTSKVEQNTYFATFIENIFSDWIVSIYPWKVIWMTKYNWKLIDKTNTFQRPLKIIWSTHSNYTNQVVDNSTPDKQGEVLNKLWNISKADIQKHIRKKVLDNIRNLKFSWSGNSIVVWDTIYYSVKNLENIEIKTNSFDNKIKNIVIVWWNAYIKENIIDTNKKVYSIISIERDGKGWNIYIDPNVIKLESTLYADKTVASYENNTILTPNTWWTYKKLRNQLYIYGSVFSNNTIWWSVKVDSNNKASCPYFIDKNNCTIEEAQKYDLYNLRAWYENLYKIWTDPYKDDNILDDLKDWTKIKDVKYPVIIEYNPSLQKAKNPFFTLTK